MGLCLCSLFSSSHKVTSALASLFVVSVTAKFVGYPNIRGYYGTDNKISDPYDQGFYKIVNPNKLVSIIFAYSSTRNSKHV